MLQVDNFSVQAEEGSGIRTTHHFEINLQPDLSRLVTYYLEIFFDSGSGVVRGITTGFPFNANEVGLTISNTSVDPTITSSDGMTTVSLDLGSNAIRPGQASTLIYTFKVYDLVKNEYNVKYLYLAKPTSDFDIDRMSVEIKYPNSFSPPTYTSSLNERPSDNSIYLNATNGVLVIWGDEVRYNVS